MNSLYIVPNVCFVYSCAVDYFLNQVCLKKLENG